MLELLKIVLDKVDIIKIAKFLRENRNRQAAAKLHLILAATYDVLALYRTILEELRAALDTYERRENAAIGFYINPARMASFLDSQWRNLEKLEYLIFQMFDEVKVLNDDFARGMKAIFPHKFGILFEAQQLLSQHRLPLGNAGVDDLAKGQDGKWRTLWFTAHAPTENRDEVVKYLHGWDGTSKAVVDINFYDGIEFFRTLKWYFETVKPVEQLCELERLAESYKQALIDNLSSQDVLAEIGSVKRYESWTRR